VLRGAVVGRTQVGALARHITIDATSTRVWAALGSKAQEIAVVDVSDPARPKLLQTMRPSLLAHDVGWSPDRRHLWVSAGADRAVLLYDLRSGKVVKRLAADGPPQHITFDGNSAYVTSGLSGTLRVHDLDGTLRSLTRVPVGSYNVQQTNGWIVTGALGHGTLTILDDAGKVLHKVAVARSSHDACVVPG
jgi:6-phosphogluconolactonase (cycloisomerase 2 family)